MNIVITGASRGIGYAVAKKLLEINGNRVVAISRNLKALHNLKSFFQQNHPDSKLFPVEFDLDGGDYENDLLPKILQHFRNIDILINNAGLLINKPVQDLSDSDFTDIFNVNVRSVFKLSQQLLPYMKKDSHIVNAGSMGGFQGSAKFPGLSLYSAAKGAVAILTEAMAEEFKEQKVKVNCLAYGAVQTEMLNEAFPGYQASLQPDEMADFVVDFAMNGHRFFNGKILPVSVSTP